MTGQCGKFDESCIPQEPPALAEMLPPMPEDQGQAAIRRFGKGKAALAGRMLSRKGWLTERITELAGQSPNMLDDSGDEQLRAVRLNVFSRGDGRREYFVHLVNYNVPLGLDAPPPREFDNLRVRLRLPGVSKDMKAVCFAPESEGRSSVKVQWNNGEISFTIPHLRIYKVVKLAVPR